MHSSPDAQTSSLLGIVERDSWRQANLTYILALALLALFSISTFLLTDSIVHQQEATARTVNISGRQRMLSQRVASLCLELATGANLTHGPGDTTSPGLSPEQAEQQTRAELRQALAQMRVAHQALVHGSDDLRLSPPKAASVLQVYFGEPYRLDRRLTAFLAAADAIAAMPSGALTPASSQLAEVEVAARAPLLNALNAAVSAYEKESTQAIQRLRRLLAGLTAAMLLIMLLEALFIYRPLFRRLQRSHAALLLVARTDPLTGSMNRRSYLEQFDVEFRTARRFHRSFAVLMFDIDRFKSINDTYGHAMGDRVITALVHASLRAIQDFGILGRIGGDEFSIILPNETRENAIEIAEQLRVSVEQERVELDGDTVGITVSLGLAMVADADKDHLDTLNRADEALYVAKQAGRNRVVAV